MQSALRERYTQLWNGSVERIRSGAIEIDPVLASGRADLRRGLTVVIRPSEQVRRSLSLFLEGLRELEPEQYYYHPCELHVTFLSLFTATVDHERFFARANDYVEAVRVSLAGAAPFNINFAGVTASAGAILIQGFTEIEALNSSRDRLRRELQVRNLHESLDDRYRLETAHMTAVRFRAPLRNGNRVVEMLEQQSQAVFGDARVESVELVKNDWYMSRVTLEHLQTFRFI